MPPVLKFQGRKCRDLPQFTHEISIIVSEITFSQFIIKYGWKHINCFLPNYDGKRCERVHRFSALHDNFNLDSCNLSFKRIFDNYPVECIPTKINRLKRRKTYKSNILIVNIMPITPTWLDSKSRKKKSSHGLRP